MVPLAAYLCEGIYMTDMTSSGRWCPERTPLFVTAVFVCSLPSRHYMSGDGQLP